MAPKSKHQRNRSRNNAGNRMKLHLRKVNLQGRLLRLISLRPGTNVRFSTNYYHDTWHIISNTFGAQLLARLLWGLSYQQKPGTAVLIYGEHIQPTPFEAEPSDPILLLPANLTAQDHGRFRLLQQKLKHLGRSQCTIRWQTHGLDAAVERFQEQRSLGSSYDSDDDDWKWNSDSKPLWNRETMCRQSGFVCYSAPPEILRYQATRIALLSGFTYDGMDYHYIAEKNHWWYPEGEIQIFSDYQARCNAAVEARSEIIGTANDVRDPNERNAIVSIRRLQLVHERELERKKAKRRKANSQHRPRQSPKRPLKRSLAIHR